jgi:NAD(P)-dependent dehydrogenase (short-subunit alcohol dehydrogenase family)
MTAKAVLIKGTGATAAAVATAHARRGYAVTILGDDSAAAREITRGIRAVGGTARATGWDLCSDAETVAGLREVSSHPGGLDALIWIDSERDARTEGDVDVAAWRRDLDTHLTSAYVLTRHAAPILAAARGSLTAVLPMTAVVATAHNPAAAAAFHGVVGLARHFSFAFGPQGMRSNVVVHSTLSAQGRPERLVPSGRLGTPAEVGRMVAHLSSPAASYTNGAVLHVDGGLGAGYFEAPEHP